MSHPLHQFTYCPKCGARTFVERNEKAKQCTTCGFVYYFNPSSAVACFIRNSKGELLLVRRAKEPAKGTLDLPGGFVDMYESAEDAAQSLSLFRLRGTYGRYVLRMSDRILRRSKS